MKGSTVKSDQRGGAPLLSFAIEPLGIGETLSTPSLPLLKARPPQCQKRGAICIEVASPMGIGQRMCPQRVCSHLDRGGGKTLEGYRECWCTSSLQPCLAPVSQIDIGQKVHQKPPAWLDHGSRRWSPCPDFPPPTPSVTRITIGVSPPLICGSLLVENSISAFCHIAGRLYG